MSVMSQMVTRKQNDTRRMRIRNPGAKPLSSQQVTKATNKPYPVV